MLKLVPSRPAAQLAESRAQHKVFLDLSARYVEQCRATGATESPALCAAADHFRRERSLATLIAFADLLETLEPTPSRAVSLVP
jgi:hypothetical protein